MLNADGDVIHEGACFFAAKDYLDASASGKSLERVSDGALLARREPVPEYVTQALLKIIAREGRVRAY